jgi:triosephosphate isomerase
MHVPFYAACSADREMCKTYQEVWNMKDVPFMIIDGTVSKTALRTNPGLMLLKDGVVVKKWSYLDYPKDMTLENGNLDLK